jgi:hypothetical protein
VRKDKNALFHHSTVLFDLEDSNIMSSWPPTLPHTPPPNSYKIEFASKFVILYCIIENKKTRMKTYMMHIAKWSLQQNCVWFNQTNPLNHVENISNVSSPPNILQKSFKPRPPLFPPRFMIIQSTFIILATMVQLGPGYNQKNSLQSLY